MNRDTVLFLLYAVATAGLSVATSHGYVQAGDAAEVASVLAAFAAAYHIPNAKAKAAIKETQSQPQHLDGP